MNQWQHSTDVQSDTENAQSTDEDNDPFFVNEGSVH